MKQFARFHERLREKADNAGMRAVTYVALGDSVTQGCMQNGVVEYEQVYHQVLRRRIERRFPGTIINVINSGVSGDTAEASRVRWERDLFLYRPDLVTICFGHNDAHSRLEGLEAFKRALADLAERVREETEAELLLMTPCMMTNRDNDAVAEVHKPLIPGFVRLAQDGILPLYAEAVRDTAAKLKVPVLDVYAMWEQMEREGTDIVSRLANGINHPDGTFHTVWGAALEQKLFSA